MGTFSNYERLLPSVAPEYLRDWAETRQWNNQALIWKVGYYRVPLTGLKERCAEAYCTACGSKMYLDYLQGGVGCHGYGIGPRLFINCEEIGNYGYTHCPECGAEVRSEHISGATSYAEEYCYPMTLERIAVQGKTDRLALIFWQVEKRHGKDGARSFNIMPWEGYVVEEKGIARCTHHGGSFGGSYNLGYWWQTKRFSDEIRDIRWTVCPEGIRAATEGTTAENSKLELYMEDGRICFPVSWLRIWQRHSNAENLLTCGAGDIVSNLIGQEKQDSRRGYNEAYGAAIPKLDGVNWKETRPGRMLGMDRGELREAVALQKRLNLGGQTWQMWLRARAAGYAWTLDDAAALEKLSRKERIANQPERPERITHYLKVQRRRWKNDKPDDTLLLDYWDRLRKKKPAEWTMEERWPERLKREHDRLVREAKVEATRALDAKIAARALDLDAWEYHFGGLFITPPRKGEDFVDEANHLHHCVDGYAERHAKSETTILFIRKENQPNKSYFTLEWNIKAGRVVQNRGNRNRDRTPDVEAFENEWVAWMLAGCPKHKEVKTA